MQDYLVRAVASDGNFRIFSARTTNTVEEARTRHNSWPVATAALGRTMTAALLMGANLKGEDTLSIRVLGDGPLGAIIVTSNAKGEVRGYVQEPQIHLPSTPEGKLAVGAAVGKGHLHITKDLGLKEPFTGSVELVSGEIAEDFAHYLTTSEQTPSAVSLGVLVDTDNSVVAAGGLILQLLPGAGEEVLEILEQNLRQLPHLSSLIKNGETPEDIIKRVTKGIEMKFLESNPVGFSCQCSRERLENLLVGIGKDEVTSMLQEQGAAEINCHFCAENYHFDKKDLQRILKRIEEKD
ncbi:Hsp33 protein [Desulforamulus reducens MI-1]|uniref:33 kDa chaperonin n=1 Tax=Desulforamulus reducens (strain ATCC BAA-1160 / DSM 100696 / MI-1) TaxID=349161 RepID=HSLO_DESRM|nr:Hsp33 family molecular chaperone HslO [Desulforamulus reducens]A4J474.1 RecName: Full=33 kDa chaperonin; AltName: Full=Heat shock protein 33 homolog; Short=HSP33 [Desulforamulus reducens MI-1]ABO49877.1 Hsp33 protein [Desulforamulus reducens MI-1]